MSLPVYCPNADRLKRRPLVPIVGYKTMQACSKANKNRIDEKFKHLDGIDTQSNMEQFAFVLGRGIMQGGMN